MKQYMLDTNIFNRLLDNDSEVSRWFLGEAEHNEFYATSIQYDELKNTKDIDRRSKLLETFKVVEELSNMKMKPTNTSIFGVSTFGMTYYGKGPLFDNILKELDGRKKKDNNPQDALIGETAIMKGYTLVTTDGNFCDVVRSEGGKVKKYL